ncbi:hypothetical protein yberc0001_26510 [Yersinia bercovieri ATCC 43970]|uniref:Uncharacterized protein n=1 Tax=Yersinia bercovieri ATCC 43970 TaxID=349968 RepID=A0ABM9XXR0_YERBE|nr:hypothetical protein yberc0001_26510 [Yersinia bercovieri ATCC 43970]
MAKPGKGVLNTRRNSGETHHKVGFVILGVNLSGNKDGH